MTQISDRSVLHEARCYRYQGLVYAMEKTNRIMASFRALATNGKVSILSAPSAIGINGRKSKIKVADSVPIVSASIVATENRSIVLGGLVKERPSHAPGASRRAEEGGLCTFRPENIFCLP